MEEFSPSVTRVDGVPVVSAPLEPVATATLVFSVGSRDETPRTSGVAHLVEHVVMRRVGRVSAPHNASTDADTIRFFVSGSDAEIVDFMTRVCEAVAWLPQATEEDVAPERRTIGAELGAHAEEGGVGPLMLRYGLVDIGLVDFGQVTYRTLPVEAVHDYARRLLHRGNAAVTITGAPPADLRLPLPDGERRAPRETPKAVRSGFPLWAVTPSAPVVLNVELAAAPGIATVAQACVEAALHRTLRTERHLVYGVGVIAFGLDDDLGNISFVLDPDLASLPAALEGAVRCLQSIASVGPSPEDFAHVLDSVRSGVAHHGAQIGWLDIVAGAESRGRAHELGTYTEESAEIFAVTPDEVRDAISAALATLLVTVSAAEFAQELPESLGLSLLVSDVRFVPENVNRTFQGVFRADYGVLGPRWGKKLRGYSLFVSEHAIAEIGPHGVFEAPLDDVVLVGRRANGIVNITTRSGRIFHLQPSDWKDPKGWIDRMLRSIPADRFYERAD